MPNLITAKRLREIKARVVARSDEITGGSYMRVATLEFVAHAVEDIPSLVATLERAVELLREARCWCEPGCACKDCARREMFLKEFDHE